MKRRHSLCHHVPYLNKWYTFTASITVALCSGLTYVFPLWSGVLKNRYGLTQGQLELIASAANVGGYSGIISGLVYDALEKHKKFGPRLVLALGMAANAAGYLGLHAAVTGFHASLWQLVALAALAANGGTWGDTCCLVTNVRNFPSSRGSVVGVMKAAVGLSGSLFASVYSGAFFPDKGRFLLFLALAPAVVGALALPFINHCSYVQKSELESGQHVFTAEGRFIFALQSLGALGIYLITGATFGSLYPLSKSARLTVTVGAGLLLLPLLLLPHGSGGLLSQKAQLRHDLSYYYDDEEEEEEEQGEDAAVEDAPLLGGGQAGGRHSRHSARGARRSASPAGSADGSAGGGGSLVQPLLEERMERGEVAGGERRQAAAGLGEEEGAAAAAVTSPADAGSPGSGASSAAEFVNPVAAQHGAGGGYGAAGVDGHLLADEGMAGGTSTAAADVADSDKQWGPEGSAASGSDGGASLEAAVAAEGLVLDASVPGAAEGPSHAAGSGNDGSRGAAAAAAGEQLGAEAGGAHGEDEARPQPPLPPDLSPMQCLRNSNFWLLFAVLTVGMGSGLTLLNNLAQLVHALSGGGSAAQVTPVLVSLFSVANFAGRLCLGHFPERLLHSRGTPRLLFLPLASLLTSATCLALAFAHLPALYPLAALAGFAFGSHWSLFPAIVSELFGLARFAANYTLAQLAPAVGSFGLAAGLAGWLYERALARHGSGGVTCIGQDCYQATFIILAVLGLGATACSTELFRRNARLYAAEVAELRGYDEEVMRRNNQSRGPTPSPRP